MPSDAETRIRAIYSRFDLDNYQPDCEWHLRADLPDSRTLRGHAEIAQNAASWTEVFDDLVLEPVELSELDGRFVVVVQLRGRIRGSGEEVAMDEVHVLSLRDGKLSEIREYNTKEEALRSLGQQR